MHSINRRKKYTRIDLAFWGFGFWVQVLPYLFIGLILSIGMKENGPTSLILVHEARILKVRY
jgi:hypothetical protein